MTELRELVYRIEELKKFLYKIVELKQDMLDPDVIAASKMLDAVLNEYNEILRQEQKEFSCKSKRTL